MSARIGKPLTDEDLRELHEAQRRLEAGRERLGLDPLTGRAPSPRGLAVEALPPGLGAVVDRIFGLDPLPAEVQAVVDRIFRAPKDGAS